MEVNVKFKLKAEQLLEKLLENECDPKTEGFLNKLLIYLWWEDKTEVTSIISVCSKWIQRAVEKWSTTRVPPPTTLIPFALSVTGLLSQNQERFDKLNHKNFFTKLVKVTKAKHPDSSVSVKLAYIKLLSSFLEHNSGLEWMIGSNFWEDILNWSLSSYHNDVVKESTSFVRKIMEKTIDFDGEFCEGVVKKIMQPLGTNVYKCVKSSTDVSDEVADQCLLPTLKLLRKLLEGFLGDMNSKGQEFGVAFLILNNFQQEGAICDFMMIAQKQCLAFDLTKIMFMMQFIELYVQVITNTTSLAKLTSSINRIESNFIAKLYRGDFQEQMDFCVFTLFYWNLMGSKIPQSKENKGKMFNFGGQFLSLLIMPHCCLLIKYFYTFPEIEAELEDDIIRDLLCQDCMKDFSLDFLRVWVVWRNRLIDRVDIFSECLSTFRVLKQALECVQRKQSILTFQCFIYFLQDINRAILKYPEKIDVFSKQPSYFLELLDTIGLLIEHFNIVLKDAVEATYVMDACLDFLSLTEWSSEIVIQALKLLNIATSHYMTASMSLLVVEKAGTTMGALGSLLRDYLLDGKVEVVQATLEVIHTLAHISNDKFPSLQKVLMDSELPTLVVKMSSCDGESFVRATAIKCLQEMIQVEEIWNNSLKTEDLTQKMRAILLDETEGIVRVEAATFMCVAYEHQQFPKDTLDRIYEAMIFSSTTDLHWEVKVRALGFWDKVIKNHLQNQGMIDGTFPNVTFSKEHRKIVTLTDSEIRKRLLKVLNQLSSIGCLGVLMSAIKDDCDMEVSKTAVKITQRLVDLFKKYNVRSDCSTPTSPLPTENGMSATVSISSGISVDDAMDSPASSQHPEINEEIMDQIVNSKDVTLLKNVYAPSDYGSVSNYDIQVRKIVTPNEFLQFTQQDLNAIISEKKKWLNGIEDLGSLLDDMLKTYDDDVNNMDCY